MGDWQLNHSGPIMEDLLGNNKEMTIALRNALKDDSKSRFRYTVVVAAMLGMVGLTFIFVPFIPKIVVLWFVAMMIGMVVAGLFGKLFSMPVTDSVSVHLKVIDYVDNVILTARRPNNLMDGSMTADELIEEESDKEDDDDECEDEEGTDTE